MSQFLIIGPGSKTHEIVLHHCQIQSYGKTISNSNDKAYTAEEEIAEMSR